MQIIKRQKTRQMKLTRSWQAKYKKKCSENQTLQAALTASIARVKELERQHKALKADIFNKLHKKVEQFTPTASKEELLKQIPVVKQKSRQKPKSKRGRRWKTKELKKALQLKFVCGQ